MRQLYFTLVTTTWKRTKKAIVVSMANGQKKPEEEESLQVFCPCWCMSLAMMSALLLSSSGESGGPVCCQEEASEETGEETPPRPSLMMGNMARLQQQPQRHPTLWKSTWWRYSGEPVYSDHLWAAKKWSCIDVVFLRRWMWIASMGLYNVVLIVRWFVVFK